MKKAKKTGVPSLAYMQKNIMHVYEGSSDIQRTAGARWYNEARACPQPGNRIPGRSNPKN